MSVVLIKDKQRTPAEAFRNRSEGCKGAEAADFIAMSVRVEDDRRSALQDGDGLTG